jgi:ribose 5-phosphate isomerase A
VTEPSSLSATQTASEPTATAPGAGRAAGIESAAVSGAETEKRAAAEAAAELVEEGMAVGLGTGSTVAQLLPALAARGLGGIRCVATSVATERQARELGIAVEEFDSLSRLDIAIDGTDEVTPDGWLIKGGGGAHLREKVVAAAAARFVVIADSSKPVPTLRGPVPLELFGFGAASTLARLGAEVELRGVPASPDGGAIADYRGEVGAPAALAARLEADPGVAAHGLFPPALVDDVLIARGTAVEHLRLSG